MGVEDGLYAQKDQPLGQAGDVGVGHVADHVSDHEPEGEQELDGVGRQPDVLRLGGGSGQQVAEKDDLGDHRAADRGHQGDRGAVVTEEGVSPFAHGLVAPGPPLGLGVGGEGHRVPRDGARPGVVVGPVDRHVHRAGEQLVGHPGQAGSRRHDPAPPLPKRSFLVVQLDGGHLVLEGGEPTSEPAGGHGLGVEGGDHLSPQVVEPALGERPARGETQSAAVLVLQAEELVVGVVEEGGALPRAGQVQAHEEGADGELPVPSGAAVGPGPHGFEQLPQAELLGAAALLDDAGLHEQIDRCDAVVHPEERLGEPLGPGGPGHPDAHGAAPQVLMMSSKVGVAR